MTRERILIVDNDDAELEAMKRGLSAHGFEIATAPSAGEALALAETISFDAAVVELRMPGTHGLHLARSLRTIQRNMVVVVTSAFAVSRRQLERCDCGASAFVAKPSDAHTVADVVRHALDEAYDGPTSITRTRAAGVVVSETSQAIA
jgi:ActR/RegA family two-component response regulator